MSISAANPALDLSNEALSGSSTPLQSSNALKDYKFRNSTPTIGTEFERGTQVHLGSIDCQPTV